MTSKPPKDKWIDGKFIFLMVIVLALLAVLYNSSDGQEIQEKEIKDFSGGLVNSISNARMQDNQALVFENFDVDDLGHIEPRHGYDYHYVDTGVTGEFAALIPYYSGLSKKLFTIRRITGLYGDYRDSLYVLTLCEDALQRCTTVVASGLFPGLRDLTYPYNASYTNLTGKLVIASTNSELHLYHEDSSWMYPARPIGPGQPKVMPISGGGTMTGTFSYKYCYRSTGAEFSNFSSPSWDVTVNRGKVIITNIGPVIDSTAISGIFLYRESGDGVYREVAEIIPTQTDPTEYIDETAGPLAAADTADFPWGFTDRNRPAPVLAPGALTVTIDTNLSSVNLTTVGMGMKGKSTYRGESINTDSYEDTMFVAYSVAFLDINGNLSMPSPATWALVHVVDSFGDTLGWKKQATLTNISMPVDSAIVKTIVLRTYSYPTTIHTGLWNAFNREYQPNTDGIDVVGLQVGSFIALDTIPTDSTPHLDIVAPSTVLDNVTNVSLPGVFSPYDWVCDGFQSSFLTTDSVIGTAQKRYQGWYWDDSVLDNAYYWNGLFGAIAGDTGYAFGEQPEIGCYLFDSVIQFRPSAIVTHGSRLYAVGDQAHIDRLYFSDFGRPFRWGFSQFINIQDHTGDWFNGLYSLGNQQLLTYKQNSVFTLQGLTFYQYSYNRTMDEIGLSAPRSIHGGRVGIYFGHKSGVYRYGANRPVSIGIKNSIDSVGANFQRSVGRVVGNEYWLSVANGAADARTNKTYIFNNSPPHVKSYDFGFTDMVLYDPDTLVQDYAVDKYIFIRSDDTLFSWVENSTDSLDGGIDRVVATYQSKYFFDAGASREQIFYIDFTGTGSADSLILTLYDMAGERTVGTYNLAVDFSANKRHRLKVDEIVTNLSIKIEDRGYGTYSLHSYIIGYMPWDQGRKQ